ncbi:fibrocystin-L [Haematococcus lacustris]|uniref:Fibrocystin-L n=1 Tax=Haematococcus lacustris TaxID=44745 RepID=A0A699Z2A2_HAELA|nr:fibrocystin-L [Haematococcus lacustris]
MTVAFRHTPATFWVTHPANTYINNHAGGSTDGYGFWYRFLQNPEGPSATGNVCPKYTPMGAFINNTAHSSMFYGLRIHPEYQPVSDTCPPMQLFDQHLYQSPGRAASKCTSFACTTCRCSMGGRGP